MATIKELSRVPERLVGGHRLCGGCGASIAVRQVMMGAGANADVVAGVATGCLEVSTSIYPYSSWKCSFIHNAFANVAASIAGVEAAYQGMKRAGKIDPERELKFVAFGGDGGTYDIGLQALSGAAERDHNMVYVCYDNGAYMNTGIQRSSATPLGSWSTTTEVGAAVPGKQTPRKDLTSIMAAHNIPYVGQAAVGYWKDLVMKAEKAFAVEGFAFLNILAPCPRGWRYTMDQSTVIGRLAVETGFWPLFEVESGEWKMTMPARARELKPVREFLETQGRFKHMFKPENEHMLEAAQAEVDEYMAYLKKMCA